MTRVPKLAVPAILRPRALQKVRAELADEQRTLKRIVEYAPIGVALTGEGGRFLTVNPALCRMLGYDRDELEGRPFSDFTHPDDLDANLHQFQEDWRRASGGSEFEKRYIAKDGTVIWALVTVSSVVELDSGQTFHVTQIQDITQRKEAERALLEERQLIKALLETTPDQIYFKDLESRFIRISHHQAARFGLANPDDALGKTDFDFFTDEHARQAFEDEQEIIRTGEPILNLEERETYSDRPDAWVSTTKLPLRDESGAIIGTFGISRDITARKRAQQMLVAAEERWRALLANSQELVMLVDSDGLFVYASPSITRWLGYTPEELLGTPIVALGHDDDDDAFMKALESACSDSDSRRTAVTVGHRLRHRDGGWHSFESRLLCLKDDPAIRAVLVDSRDVTEHLAVEQERARLELERRVSQRLEAVGQLSAGIAHEINTPMQFVGDSVTFLREAMNQLLILMAMYHELLTIDEPIDRGERIRRMTIAEEEADLEYLRERIPNAFTRTIDGISRVTQIVQAMKRFAHPAGQEAMPSDLNDAIETTLEVCRNEYKYAADVTLALGDLPPVTCNVGEINQVLLNLIINAAHAIEERVEGSQERGTISISTRVDGEHVVIEITDDGVGIAPEHMDRIYEPFFTTKEIGRGSGQGLALARTTIEQHSGSIACASARGEGTTFTIRLPLGPPGATAEAVQPRRAA
jgi:PAS domain S-box-containing protein